MVNTQQRAMSRTGEGDDSRLDAVFGALADRTRRRILVALARGPASVGELAAPFDISLPGVSKHLRVLERAGLLRRQLDGRFHRCQLDAQPLRAAAAFMTDYRAFWEDSLDKLADYVERPPPPLHGRRRR
jgi:DNA-binding transcriptional ArsR family regulator